MKKYLPITIIFLIGFFLRFNSIENIPVSLHRDEAFLGYNGYSILKTGKDISGDFFPIHLESFFYSPSGYSYFVIPFIAVFGLTEFAVRTPAALFGSLTVLLVYFVTVKIFEKEKSKKVIGLFAAFFLAISPWHINLSRVATENIVVLFFILLGIFCYLQYIKSMKLLFLLGSFLSFFATLFIYQAPRAFLPLFIPLLLFSFNSVRGLIKIRAEYVLFMIVIILPVLMILFSPQISWRIQSLSIFHHPETQLTINEQLTTDGVQNVPYLVSRMFHNKLVGFGLLFFENFFKHFTFDFLFLDDGLPERYRVPKMGLLHLFELPLLLFSAFYMLKEKLKISVFLFGWIVLGIVGTALTFDDVPNLQRTVIIVPAFSIILGYGTYILWKFLKSHTFFIRAAVVGTGILIICMSIFYYLLQYYVHAKVYRPWVRQDGYEELVQEVNSRISDYDAAVVTIRESAPSIFFLFYGNYDPASFQKQTKNHDMKQSDHVSFGKYIFDENECPLMEEKLPDGTLAPTGKRGTLYVNSGACKDPVGSEVLHEVRREDNSEAFKILDVK